MRREAGNLSTARTGIVAGHALLHATRRADQRRVATMRAGSGMGAAALFEAA